MLTYEEIAAKYPKACRLLDLVSYEDPHAWLGSALWWLQERRAYPACRTIVWADRVELSWHVDAPRPSQRKSQTCVLEAMLDAIEHWEDA